MSNLRQSAEELISAIQKNEATLDSLARKLEEESAARFRRPGEVDPVQLARRVRRLASELPELQAACQELLSLKQGLVDAAQQQLASNYARLRAVCEAAGAQHADDSVYGSFQEAVGEWNRKLQHGHVAAAGGQLSRQDLNAALAGAAMAAHM